MKKIILTAVIIICLNGCDDNRKITDHHNIPEQKVKINRESGIGMSYSGKPGLNLGGGMVMTSKGLELGFGF